MSQHHVLFSKARNSKSKQGAAAKAAAAAAATASAVSSTTTAAPTLPAAATPSRKTTPKSAASTGGNKGRAPVVNVTASATASLLGSRAQSAGATIAGQSLATPQNNSLLAGLGKVAAVSPTTINVTKPPVVTVTKQGLTPGSRPGSAAQPAAEVSVGNSSATRQSPIILAQEASSRSSTPTSVTVATPPPSGKLVTLAQTAGVGSGAVVVTGAGDSAMITQLVARGQQVVSVGSLPARGLNQAVGQQRGTTLKIQGQFPSPPHAPLLLLLRNCHYSSPAWVNCFWMEKKLFALSLLEG